MSSVSRRRRTMGTAAGVSAAVLVASVGSIVSIWCTVSDDQSVAAAVINNGAVLAFALVGAVVAAARPGNVVGWFMLLGGVCWSGGSALVDLAHHGIVVAPGSVAGASAFAVAGSAVRAIGWFLVTLAVPVYFPDGKLASRRWRWLPWAVLVILLTSALDAMTDRHADLTDFGSWQNPLAVSTATDVLSAVAFLCHTLLAVVVTVAAVVQLVQRWRSGDALRRQQLVLFAAAVALTLCRRAPGARLRRGTWIFGAPRFRCPSPSVSPCSPVACTTFAARRTGAWSG